MPNIINGMKADSFIKDINTHAIDDRGGYRAATQGEIDDPNIETFKALINGNDVECVRDKDEKVEVPFLDVQKLQTSNHIMGELLPKDKEIDTEHLWVQVNEKTEDIDKYKLYQRAEVQQGLVLPASSLSQTRNYKVVFDKPGTYEFHFPKWAFDYEGYIIDGGNGGFFNNNQDVYPRKEPCRYVKDIISHGQPVKITVGAGGKGQTVTLGTYSYSGKDAYHRQIVGSVLQGSKSDISSINKVLQNLNRELSAAQSEYEHGNDSEYRGIFGSSLNDIYWSHTYANYLSDYDLSLYYNFSHRIVNINIDINNISTYYWSNAFNVKNTNLTHFSNTIRMECYADHLLYHMSVAQLPYTSDKVTNDKIDATLYGSNGASWLGTSGTYFPKEYDNFFMPILTQRCGNGADGAVILYF